MLIAKRRLLFIDKIIRKPCKKIPARLISAFLYKKIPRRRPNTTVIHFVIDDIRKIIPSVDKYGSFKTWAHIANDEVLWLMLVNNLGRDDPQPCNFSPEWDEEISENGPPRSPPSSHPHSPPPFSLPKSPPPVNNYSNSFTDLFKFSSINPTSNKREVIVACRTLATIYHPDKYYDNIKEFSREEGEEKFNIISNEYEDLKNSNNLF